MTSRYWSILFQINVNVKVCECTKHLLQARRASHMYYEYKHKNASHLVQRGLESPPYACSSDHLTWNSSVFSFNQCLVPADDQLGYEVSMKQGKNHLTKSWTRRAVVINVTRFGKKIALWQIFKVFAVLYNLFCIWKKI